MDDPYFTSDDKRNMVSHIFISVSNGSAYCHVCGSRPLKSTWQHGDVLMTCNMMKA